MVARIGVLCACLLVAAPAAADTMVTWTGEGTVFHTFSRFPLAPHLGPAIPIGTPVSVSVSFDPALQGPTFNAPPAFGCVSVPVSGSVTLDGHTFNSTGLGFTNAALPGTTCTSADFGRTEFSLHSYERPTDNPWPAINGPGVFILGYQDLMVENAFPSEPTLAGNAILSFTFVGSDRGDWGFSSAVSLGAADVDQVPVPEPATLTLFGVGLAVLHRARKNRAG